MKPIAPDEMEITGTWITVQTRVEKDAICERIANLVKNHLVEVGHDKSGWDTLFRDPVDGRFWELICPQSQLQGGGPPQLRCLSADVAESKYAFEL